MSEPHWCGARTSNPWRLENRVVQFHLLCVGVSWVDCNCHLVRSQARAVGTTCFNASVYGVVLCERAVDTEVGAEALTTGSIMSEAMPQAGNGAGRTRRCAKYADSSTVSHKTHVLLVEPFVYLLFASMKCFYSHSPMNIENQPL